MKKILYYALILSIVLSILLAGQVAYAAGDSINTSVTVSPTSLPGEGTVSVSVKINNNGDAISNVRLKYPSPTDTVISMGDMPPGTTKEHNNPEWHIYESMLGQNLAFTVMWVSADGTEKSGTTQTFVISKQDPTLKVSGSVTADPMEVDQGQKTQFKFSFKNEGNVNIENAKLTAPPIDGGAQIGDTFNLAPGETNNKTYNVPINSDMTVNAVYTYESGGQQYSYELPPLTVKVKAPPVSLNMALTLQADKTTVASGDEVTYTVTVQNTGNSRLDGLTVTDFLGNKLNLGTSALEAGNSATGVEAIKMTSSGNYAFVASAVGAGGEAVNAQSNSIAITVDGANPSVPADDIDPNNVVKTVVRVGATDLPGPGEVTVTASVQNLTDLELKNVVVLNDIIGTIGSAASLPGGQTVEFQKTFTAESTNTYVFKTSAQLPDNRLVESQTSPATIEVGNAPPGMSTSMMGFIIILVAIAAVGIVLAVYLYRNRKKISNKTGTPTRPLPSGVYPQQRDQVSPSGRTRPEHYSQSQEDGYRSYKNPKPQRIEVIDPETDKNAPVQPRRVQPKENNVKFGDRNKF